MRTKKHRYKKINNNINQKINFISTFNANDLYFAYDNKRYYKMPSTFLEYARWGSELEKMHEKCLEKLHDSFFEKKETTEIIDLVPWE